MYIPVYALDSGPIIFIGSLMLYEAQRLGRAVQGEP